MQEFEAVSRIDAPVDHAIAAIIEAGNRIGHSVVPGNPVSFKTKTSLRRNRFGAGVRATVTEAADGSSVVAWAIEVPDPKGKGPGVVDDIIERIPGAGPVEQSAVVRVTGSTTQVALTPMTATLDLQITMKGLLISGKKYPIEGAKATMETGAQAASRMTATRVAAGAIVLGPLGALLGGMAKKDMSKLFVVIELGDGRTVTAEVKAKHEAKVRRFVTAVNEAGSATRPVVDPGPEPEISASPPPPPPPSVPAGWYPDSNGQQVQRYWDGTAWTQHTAPLAP